MWPRPGLRWPGPGRGDGHGQGPVRGPGHRPGQGRRDGGAGDGQDQHEGPAASAVTARARLRSSWWPCRSTTALLPTVRCP